MGVFRRASMSCISKKCKGNQINTYDSTATFVDVPAAKYRHKMAVDPLPDPKEAEVEIEADADADVGLGADTDTGSGSAPTPRDPT